MYAKKEGEKILIYGELPSNYKNHTNFSASDAELLEKEGFFEIVEDKLPANKQYGELYFDNDVFRYEITDTPAPIWHVANKTIQLIITGEQKKNWLDKAAENEILGNYPEITILLDYIKTLNCQKIHENGNLYIYLEELYNTKEKPHKIILQNFGIEINYKDG